MSLRRIRKADCQQDFDVGDPRFDYDNKGKKLGLAFYYERDRSGRFESYILEEKGRILGIVCIQPQKESLYLSRLGIKRGHHGKGYGKKLLKFAILRAKQLDLHRIALETKAEHIGFYEDLGFETIRKYCDSHWGDSATMELTFLA